MLPHPTSPDFPLALRTARLNLNLTRGAFADKINLSRKLLRKYEEPENKHFTIPRKKTWIKMNNFLGYEMVENINEDSSIAVINIFTNTKINNILIKIEEKFIQENKSINCKTHWQPSSPYYRNEH